MIHLQCPSCQQNLEIADYLAGLPIVCKFCSVSVPVPARPQAESAPSPTKLAERLEFIKNEKGSSFSPLTPRPSPFVKSDQPRTPGRTGLAGIGVVLVAGIVVLTAFLNQGNEKKPDKEIAQNKPSDPKPGPVEIEYKAPLEKQPPQKEPPAKEPPDDPPKEDPKEAKPPAPLSPDEIYQRVVRSTAWVFDRQDFAGSEWVGKEDRPGGGSLEFFFAPSALVQMQTAKGKILGTWTKDGDDLSLRFQNGLVVYSGTLEGKTIKGTAKFGRLEWNWSATRSGKGIGTGVLVDKKHRLLMTNVHVVGDSPGVTVYFPEFADDAVIAGRDHYHKKPGIAGKVVLREARADLALVQLEELPEGVEAVPLSAKSARPAQAVLSVGNPGISGALWNPSSGQVRQVFPHKWKAADSLGKNVMSYNAWVLETTSAIKGGDSGGPLLDGQGNLIGIAHAVHRVAKDLSVFIDVRECHIVLKDYYQALGEAPE